MDIAKRTRLLFVDDRVEFRRLFELFMEEHQDLEIVGMSARATGLEEKVLQLQPDVVVLDISMPILSGLEAAARLADGGCAARVLFLTVHEDPAFVEAARNVGALGYVVKRTIGADLLPAIRLVLGGRPAFPSASSLRPDGAADGV